MTTTRFVTGSAVTLSDALILLLGSVSFSWLVTLTTFGMVPLPDISAMIYRTTVSFAFRLPMLAMPVSGLYVMPVRLESNETKCKRLSNLSVMFTYVALLGPLLVTFIVYLTLSPTYATVTFTSFVMLMSTRGSAVMLSIVSLLLDSFLSVSLLFTATKFAIVPFELTIASMVN